MGEEDLNQLLSLLEKQNLISLLTYLTSDVVGKKLAAKNIEIIKKFLSPSKSIDETSLSTKKDISKKQLKQDNFEISKYRQRQIAFQIQYDGSAYSGFASQDCNDTIENFLFKSFLKLRLISDRQSCNYSRCGRTDKGVSALGQIISLRVRSKIPKDTPDVHVPLHPCDPVVLNSTPEVEEMDYCTMLNRSLPEDIRVIGWTEVTSEFSARFSAAYRTYRYFFVRRRLNIGAMQEAARKLVGNHDFSNFCKMDIANVSNFRRDVYSARIVRFRPSPPSFSERNGQEEMLSEDEDDFDERAIWMFEIRGIAFLWHMVRCIMAVLFMVGGKDCGEREAEKPEIVSQLLDTVNYPSKPSYAMAPEQPLVLHQCGFDCLNIAASSLQPSVLWQLTAHFEGIWERHMLAAARAENALQFLRHDCQVREKDVAEFAAELRYKSEEKGKKRPAPSVECEVSDDVSSARSLPDNDLNKRIEWSEALKRYFDSGFYPKDVNSPPYIPLLKRKTEGTYEERVRSLSGNKKDRFERHLTLSATQNDTSGETLHSTGDTAAFFARMRQQGAVRERSDKFQFL